MCVMVQKMNKTGLSLLRWLNFENVIYMGNVLGLESGLDVEDVPLRHRDSELSWPSIVFV